MGAVTMGKLSGKVALITGASSGIGAATAILFSSLGADLALSGRNFDNLRKTGEQCEAAKEGAGQKKPLLVQADLVKEADTVRLMDDTIKEFGRLDILVNNAGIIQMGSKNTTLDQYDSVMNTNVRSL